MRIPFLSAAFLATLCLAGASVAEAGQITFDLNAPDALLQGTTAPYATVTVSSQGTGTANFSVVADGAYSLTRFLFQTDPGTFFIAQPKADFTGATGGNGFDSTPIAFGKAGASELLPTDQFGGFGFGYEVLFGSVKSLSFTLTGPFVSVVQGGVIRPNLEGFLAAAQIDNNGTLGWVAGNGSPTRVAAVPEPSPLALLAPLLALTAVLYGRSMRNECRRRALTGQ